MLRQGEVSELAERVTVEHPQFNILLIAIYNGFAVCLQIEPDLMCFAVDSNITGPSMNQREDNELIHKAVVDDQLTFSNLLH